VPGGDSLPQSSFLLTLNAAKVEVRIQGAKAEVAVLYRESLATQEMGYPRLSRRVILAAVYAADYRI